VANTVVRNPVSLCLAPIVLGGVVYAVALLTHHSVCGASTSCHPATGRTVAVLAAIPLLVSLRVAFRIWLPRLMFTDEGICAERGGESQTYRWVRIASIQKVDHGLNRAVEVTFVDGEKAILPAPRASYLVGRRTFERLADVILQEWARRAPRPQESPAA
jgi:hypothetical protein